MKNKGFTLIELLAVIVILAIILAIAVPSIANMINSSTKSAFESDAKLVLTTVDYKKMEDEAFNETNLTEDNIKSLLGLSSDNYESVNVIKEDGTTIISIVGKNKWAGLIACGTSKNMKIVASLSDCSNDVIQPVITLNGNATVSINQDEIYTDLGATALDNKDGNVTSKIIVTSNINPSIPGVYTVIYAVTDMAGNKGTSTRTVNVIDNVSPTVSFGTNGNNIYAKTRSTTVTITDVGGIDILKYLWNTSTTAPIESSFTNNFINGDDITSPSDLTGSYYLWILGKDKAGNIKISKSNVFNLDNTIPVITVTGTNPITINKGSTYTDAGATATDNIDATVTVASTGSVNPNVVGTYTITYNATDSSGNIAVSKTRTINVVDANAPTITIVGTNPISITAGSTYTDAGATALDDVDGNVTSKITTTSDINPNMSGTYNVTYTVKDNANNTATATRIVNVIDNVAPTITFGTNGNGTYAKTASSTITVTDQYGTINTSSLKYLWNTSTTPPTEASFSTTYTSGGSVTIPANSTGIYYLWAMAKDNSGNTTIIKTNAFKLDNAAPIINILGASSITIKQGTTYTDAGATATDNADATINVVSSGTVNASVVGTYTITYNATDSSGNIALSVNRTVIVQSPVNFGLTLWFDGADFKNSPASTTWTDKSGSNYIATPTNFSYTASSGSDGNGGIVFDGVNDHMPLSKDVLTGNVDWTISMWVKTTSFLENYLFTNASGGPVCNALKIYNGKIGYMYYRNETGWNQNFGNINISDGNWHMLTWINYANGTMDLYVDTAKDITIANAKVNAGYTGPINLIGKYWGDMYYAGALSDIRMYNRTLSLSEITTLYGMR